MNLKAIAISGTPGVGKTEVALSLSRTLGATYVNLTEFVMSNKLYLYYDHGTSSYVINEELVKAKLREIIRSSQNPVVLDGHYSELVDDELVNKIVVLRLDPRVLYIRLKERGWTDRKIIDNVESELLGICTLNALELHSSNKVCEVDTTNKSVEEVIKEVFSIVKGELDCRIFVDWLNNEEVVLWVLNNLHSSTSI